MPERRIVDLEYSSLPTPATSESGFTVQPVDKNGQPTNDPNERWYHPETGRLLQKGITQTLRENDLLRTPSVTDSTGGAISEKQARERNRMVKIADQAAELAFENGKKVSPSIERSLLPTPVASEGTKAPSQQTTETKSKTGQVWLSNAAKDMEINWGRFESAIQRWEEVLGRPAPAPTKPDGKDGAHRLSSAFTEWMMGVPEGWITDCGLSRNEELKACGNGVVPQQAELALRMLLDGIDLRIEAGGGTMLPTPTVSDTFTGNLKSTQQKPGSMHSVTLPQAVRWVANEE